MNRVLAILITVLFFGNLYSQPQETFPESFNVRVTNPLNSKRENVLIIISPNLLKKIKGFNSKAFIVLDGEEEVPSQFNLRDDGHRGVVFVLKSLAPAEKREVTIRYHSTAVVERVYPKRTQAELSHKTGGTWKDREYQGGSFKNVSALRVPPEHKDHSWFIRYEGPGWESDKVGYRFYLDQRNATDVFGKLTPEPVLQNVGLDGFDSYHNMQPWGMDVMKVGQSLGIGSIGSFVKGAVTRVEKTDSVSCEITENGAVYSSIETNYYGWMVNDKRTNVKSLISIHGGTRLSKQSIILSHPLDNVCTGIVKDKAGTLITGTGTKTSYGYIATYGTQSLNSDNLGLAIFYNPENLIEVTSDEFSHVVKLKTSKNKLEYFYAAAWEKEPGGIKDQQSFESYVKQVASELANPVKVEVIR